MKENRFTGHGVSVCEKRLATLATSSSVLRTRRVLWGHRHDSQIPADVLVVTAYLKNSAGLQSKILDGVPTNLERILAGLGTLERGA